MLEGTCAHLLMLQVRNGGSEDSATCPGYTASGIMQIYLNLDLADSRCNHPADLPRLETFPNLLPAPCGKFSKSLSGPQGPPLYNEREQRVAKN